MWPCNILEIYTSICMPWNQFVMVYQPEISSENMRMAFWPMVLDLALQFAGTTSVYVAAFVSLQDMYQLSAAAAALPQFSSFALGVGSWALHRSKKYRSLVVWCICHFFCWSFLHNYSWSNQCFNRFGSWTNHFLCIADGSARLCGAFGGRRFGWQTSLRRVHTPYACDDRSECHATGLQSQPKQWMWSWPNRLERWKRVDL